MLSQGSEEFDGVDDEFEEACAEEKVFGAARAEEIVSRASLKRAGNMENYVTGTANKPNKEGE